MRSVILSFLLASSLGACATVSMVASEALVETNLTAEETSLRRVSDAYTDLAERKQWIAQNKGLLGFAQILLDGSGDEEAEQDSAYLNAVASEAPTLDAQLDQIQLDIESASHGLDVATMEAEKLYGAELSARALRADLVSYESALVTAKKARRTFIAALTELSADDANSTTYALAQFDTSIDAARDTADKLADYAASRRNAETSS